MLTDLQHLGVVFPLSSDDHVTWDDAPLFVEDLVASDLALSQMSNIALLFKKNIRNI